MKKIKFEDIEMGMNISLDSYPNGERASINSKVRELTEWSVTLWWFGSEFTINKKDIVHLYQVETMDDIIPTGTLIEFFDNIK